MFWALTLLVLFCQFEAIIMAESYTEPAYSADENDGFVRMRVKLDGLKVQKKSFWDWVWKVRDLPEGKNADILKPTITERSFELIVKGHSGGAMQGEQYKLSIKKLPYAIVPADSYIEGETGWLNVFLKKQDEDTPWEKFIRSGSLETADE